MYMTPEIIDMLDRQTWHIYNMVRDDPPPLRWILTRFIFSPFDRAQPDLPPTAPSIFRKRKFYQHIARGILEVCIPGCLKFIHLNGETDRIVSLCVHVRIFEILSCAFAEADTIRHYQSIRNNAATERN